MTENLLVQVAADQLVESKLDRESNFETPVAVFVLHVELYAVTRGLASVGRIEQPEQIDTAFTDGARSHLIVGIIEIGTGLCRCGGPRGQCVVFLRKG